jgi:hypothetical protein
MAQERNEREAARDMAAQSLKNELELAVRLIRKVKERGLTRHMEQHAVDSAREAFRHAVEALNRLPQLQAHDMEEVQRLIDEFRSELTHL